MESVKSVEDLIRTITQQVLEAIMEAEREVFLREHGGQKNGYYTRDLDTTVGRLKALRVPRDREGQFRTQLFRPYQRRTLDVEALTVALFRQGLSARRVGEILKEVLGFTYSPGTVTEVAKIAREEIQKWRARPLKSRYVVLYLDAMFVPLRRDTVSREAIYMILGVDEEGHREILDFAIYPQEGARVWEGLLRRLVERGVREVLLVVADGLAGMEEAVKSVFPRADVQRCVVHALRQTRLAVRRKDWEEVLQGLRAVLDAKDWEAAMEAFRGFRERWRRRYPRVVSLWEKHLGSLLAYFAYPGALRKTLRSTNLLERVHKEMRRRFRVIEVFPSVESLEGWVYWMVVRMNMKWEERRLWGFVQTRRELQDLFRSRYLTQNS
ncbi:MAG: IS256 family transposase [Candidatus Hydrothermae bacterium]|nr:IS256 family transposase [Candidatus Hydrothermae bacterium]